MDKLKAMRTFVQIAADGSLTQASRSLGLSLPAVVRRLAELEEHLGVRLLNRTTRRISLTREGQHYLHSCRDILAAVDTAEAALATEHEAPSGSLTVTAPVLFGQYYVAPAVTRFVQRYDRVRCRVYLNDRNVDLLEEQVDVGVRIGELPDSSLIAHRVGSVRRVVVAAPEYLQRQGVPAHPRDLLQANCVQVMGRWNPWTFVEHGRTFAVPVSGNLDCNQIAPAIDACVAGLGIGLFLYYQVAAHLADRRLVPVLEAFEQPPRPISVVYPHAQLLPARTRAFIGSIREELKAALARGAIGP